MLETMYPLWEMALWNSPRARACHELDYAQRAGGLAEDRDVAGVAAESRDVVANPAQRFDLIEQSVVARGGRALTLRSARDERDNPARRVDS